MILWNFRLIIILFMIKINDNTNNNLLQATLLYPIKGFKDYNFMIFFSSDNSQFKIICLTTLIRQYVKGGKKLNVALLPSTKLNAFLKAIFKIFQKIDQIVYFVENSAFYPEHEYVS